jgi:integrase
MAGEGSIYQRADGKWVAQLSLGTRTDRTYLRRVRPTRKAAAAALDELRAERKAWSNPSSRSLGDYLRRWLAESVSGNVAPSTLRGYGDAVVHFAPIAHIALADLRADHIEEACNRMRATKYMGRTQPLRDLGPASPKTVRNAQLMLRAALEVAYQRGHVRRNEAKLVRLAHVPKQHRSAMTGELARRILAATEGDRYEAAYALAMCALRASEVLGLSRADVDLESGTVHVWRQLRGSGRHAELAPLKTIDSEGYIDLPDFALERVRRHLERHDPVALMFTTEQGLGVSGDVFTKHFQRLIAAAGIPRMTVHDLRAGAATLLAEQGAHPRMAQEYLRHSSEVTTLRHYTRTTPEQRRATAQLLNRAVTGESRGESRVSAPESDEVGRSGPDEGETGSGGRIRTYDQAVNSRPPFRTESALGVSRRESRE